MHVDNRYKGTKILGDPNTYPTDGFGGILGIRRLLLRVFSWNTVVAFEVSTEIAKSGYRVGWREVSGKNHLFTQMLTCHRFGVLVPFETGYFYAVNLGHDEVTLKFLKRTISTDRSVQHLEIYHL